MTFVINCFKDQAERLKQEYHKSMTIYNTKLESDKKTEKVEAQNNKSEVKISKVRIPKSKPENENPKAKKKILQKNENKSATPAPEVKNGKKEMTEEVKKETGNSEKPEKAMLAMEKGKLISKGGKDDSKKKAEKKLEKKKIEKKKSKRETEIPSDRTIEKYLIKVIQKANLEHITMKQVLKKVEERYPLLDISSKKSFIKSKVKEMIQ